jgi:gluconate kinase
MGVSGCDKSSVGQKLSEHLGLSFIEADQLHPQANIAKCLKVSR